MNYSCEVTMAIVREEKDDTQLISVMGLPMSDLVYYMARTLNVTGKKCLVVDNSTHHELFKCIRKPENEKMAQTGEIYYICNIAYSEAFFAQYDFVIIYHGMSIDAELNELSDFRYLVTDYVTSTTEEISNELSTQEENLDYHVVFRNKAFTKISERLILSELGLSDKNVIDKHELIFNEQDYMCYLGLLRNGVAQLKSISPEMKEFLKAVLMDMIPDKEMKEYTSLMKKVVSGKIL